jgi:hypothetical protein
MLKFNISAEHPHTPVFELGDEVRVAVNGGEREGHRREHVRHFAQVRLSWPEQRRQFRLGGGRLQG